MLFHSRFSESMGNPYYEVAQVCLNGHVITSSFNQYPEQRRNFCSDCGAKTIHQCPNCSESIQGEYVVPGVAGGGFGFSAPAFCHNCGQAFPWTETRLQAARELIMMSEELFDEKDELADALPDLVTDTPKTTVATAKWKRALGKVGKYTTDAFRDILVDIVSETTKKVLFP